MKHTEENKPKIGEIDAGGFILISMLDFHENINSEIRNNINFRIELSVETSHFQFIDMNIVIPIYEAYRKK